VAREGLGGVYLEHPALVLSQIYYTWGLWGWKKASARNERKLAMREEPDFFEMFGYPDAAARKLKVEIAVSYC
jgi:hypothetical protein